MERLVGNGKLVLVGSESRCHQTRSIVVRSRGNGFVTQNCEACGTPRALGKGDLPGLVCGACGRQLDHFINANKNYAYRCSACGVEFELAALVPHWDEVFVYCGYALDTDEPRARAMHPLTSDQLTGLRETLRRLAEKTGS